jgi:hypothetical protein
MTNKNKMIETVKDQKTGQEAAGAAYICDRPINSGPAVIPAPQNPKRPQATAPAKPLSASGTPSLTAVPSAAPLVLPKAIDPKYTSETPGRARMFSCVDQYNANKATNSNGGMKWIEMGGGYYSVCNQRLRQLQ